MSTAKTKVDRKIVEDFVRAHFASNADHFESITEGEGSQAFFFKKDKEDFVIRVNKGFEGFKKDKYAFEHFYSTEIPIPETISLGKLNEDLHYSITKRAEGKLLSDCDKEEIVQALPSLISALDAIHSFDISNTTKFGYFDSKGEASLSSWKEHVEKLFTDIPQWLEKEANNKLLEKEVLESLMDKYRKLIGYAPEERYLVHGDYGFNNAMTLDGKLTAVFDWEQAMYGDFLYDIAWLDFWGNDEKNDRHMDYKQIFSDHYQKQGIRIQNYNERVLLYELNLGIKSLSFYIYSNQESKYHYSKQKLLKLTEFL